MEEKLRGGVEFLRGLQSFRQTGVDDLCLVKKNRSYIVIPVRHRKSAEIPSDYGIRKLNSGYQCGKALLTSLENEEGTLTAAYLQPFYKISLHPVKKEGRISFFLIDKGKAAFD